MSMMNERLGFVLIFLWTCWNLCAAQTEDFALMAAQRSNRIELYTFSSGVCSNLPLQNLEGPTGIDYDPQEKKIYWTEFNGGRIARSRIDGSNQETLLSNLTAPYGLALDIEARLMYWSSEGAGGAVERANLDGSDRRIIASGSLVARHLLLDSSNSLLYVADVGPRPGEIERMNTDGSNRTRVIGSDLSFPLGIAMDRKETRILWSGYNQGSIQSSDLSGQEKEVVYHPGALPGDNSYLTDLALYGDYIYFTNGFTSGLHRVLRNGSSTAERVTGCGSGVYGLHIHVGLEPPVQCNELFAPTNGFLTPNGPHYSGTEVRVTCREGFELSGAEKLSCHQNGTWSGEVAMCEEKEETVSSTLSTPLPVSTKATTTLLPGTPPVECNKLSAPMNGDINNTDEPYIKGVIVGFSCDSGYELVGSRRLLCTSDGTWSNKIPTCIKKEKAKPKLSEGNIRLVGPNKISGRVEIFHAGQWGTICDNRKAGGVWNLDEANVVCRQLGFPEAEEALRSPTKDIYQKGNGKIWVKDLICVGEEESLLECRIYNAKDMFWGNTQMCTHDNDVGVICAQEYENLPLSSSTTIAVAVSMIIFVLLVILIVVGLCIYKNRKTRWSSKSELQLDSINVSPLSTKPGHFDSDKGNEFCHENIKLGNEIGHGAFGVVYKAEMKVSKTASKFVAVKMLKAESSETARNDFMKELNLYKTMEYHPNVIGMVGSCINKDPMYLILEYAPNGNLKSYLDSVRTGEFESSDVGASKYLSPTELLTFADQITCGMTYLSSKQCVHRDLATRNILLGEHMVCKLSDFGLARDLAGEQQYEMKSTGGRVPVRWLAPESVLHNLYTTKSDVWSFGILVWELVTLGAHPYPGMSSKQVIDAIKNGYRLPKPEHCSDEIFSVMMQCWHVDPKMRPDFKELKKTLENMLASAQGYLEMGDFDEHDYIYISSLDQEVSWEENTEYSNDVSYERYVPS